MDNLNSCTLPCFLSRSHVRLLFYPHMGWGKKVVILDHRSTVHKAEAGISYHLPLGASGEVITSTYDSVYMWTAWIKIRSSSRSIRHV